jgi:adenylosuccinate synthase
LDKEYPYNLDLAGRKVSIAYIYRYKQIKLRRKRLMKADVVIGLQWGDEGKGKIVDVLTPNYEVVARFQGGPNAGHSLEFNDKKFVLHTVPSGIFREGTINIIGNGVVVDPVILQDEIEKLEVVGVNVDAKLQVSKKAHLILPSHRMLDAASEAAKGKTKIGSTLKGIGPAYMDKTGRNGLRVGDILLDSFKEKYEQLRQKHIGILKQYEGFNSYEKDLAAYEEKWFKSIGRLKRLMLVDSEHTINKLLKQNKRLLAEGAQGSLLDMDFGTYPYVTSSNTVCAGACTGLGIAPSSIGEVYGIFKAYCTRVGSGPFPTELNDEVGERLRAMGKEFGATTGRPRRTGWLDMVALKYAVMISGVTKLIMMKTDILDTFETIKIAAAYRVDGVETEEFPYDVDGMEVEPIYREFKGWNQNLSSIKAEKDFPQELKDYIAYIEQETGVPIYLVSVGSDREETIIR